MVARIIDTENYTGTLHGLRRVNGHYPPVWSEYLSRVYLAAIEKNDKETLRELKTCMDMPFYNYCALPQARRFHASSSRYRWCLGGNRSSKSESVCYEVVSYATGRHPWKKITTPNVGWYCTNTWELVGSILWEKLEYYLTGFNIRVQWRHKAGNLPGIVYVETPYGESAIVFKAYEQGRELFQGTERRYIANDEQFGQDIFHEQISRVGPGNPLDFYTAMTPIKPQPWLEERLTIDKPESWDVFEYPLDDNRLSRGGFIPDTDIDMLIAEWPDEVTPTRRLGKWGSFAGSVYKSFNRSLHVVNETDEKQFFFPNGKIPVQQLAIGGVDFGGANPFVFLWAVRLPHMDNAWYVFDEYYWEYRSRGVRLLRDHAKEIKKRTREWDTHLHHSWADHDVQDRMELHAEGVDTQAANKDVLPGIETVQTALHVHPVTQRPHLYFAERCKHTIRQISAYHWPDGTDTRDPVDNPVKVEDHACDAVRYILHSDNKAMPSGRKLNVNRGRRRF